MSDQNREPEEKTVAAEPPRRRLGHKVRRSALAFMSLFTLAFASGTVWLASFDPPSLARAESHSTLVVDRNGKLLRPFTTPDGLWRLPVKATEVDPKYLEFLRAYEDRRFGGHRGVDPMALVRAAWQALESGRIVSGGSTLTMQTARLLEPDRSRTLTRKIKEIGSAVALERAVGKDRVLDLYLTLAPYGGNLEGVRAASLAYFGKEPQRLSNGEAALLVALPQSPEARRPDRDPKSARAARDRVLDRLGSQGVLTGEEIAHAKDEDVPQGRIAFPAFAAHASEDAAKAATPQNNVVGLTIDRDAQAALELLAKERSRNLGPAHSMAILVVEHATGAVRAHVGSADYFDGTRAGHVDQARAVRSPGSTLKPFIYGMAFEDGIAHPKTVIEDRPTRFGRYAPKNFGEDYKGTVNVEQALQMSLNVPAVAVLEAVGPARLAARIHAVGANLKLPLNEAPGLAIGLGGVGTTLFDLATLYTGLARGGEVVPLYEREPQAGEGHRLLDPVAAWQIAQILLGTPAPVGAEPGRIAYKTGTSYGFRDAWAVGFDGRYVVAVWTGRPDGTPSPGLVGRNSAAPILFDAFGRIEQRPQPLPPAPYEATLIPKELPPALARFQPHGEILPQLVAGDIPLSIAYPADGVKVDLGGGSGISPLALKAAGGTPPFTWMVDGRPIVQGQRRRESSWMPPGRGFTRLTVLDGQGRSATAMVRID